MKFVFLASWLLLPLTTATAETTQCYILPGDPQWPSSSTWDQLNATVQGRLIATVPIGAPCHDPHFDGEACQTIQNEWSRPELRYVKGNRSMPLVTIFTLLF
jgi:hypothetical protein